MTHIGSSRRNQWMLGEGAVDLVRRPAEPRPATLAGDDMAITLDLAATALVVVDLQNAFCHPDIAVGDKAVARRPIAPLNAVLPGLRSAGVPVIWLNWGNRADGLNLPPGVLMPFQPDGLGHSFIVRDSADAAPTEGLDVQAGDIRVDKYRVSGFQATQLDQILRNLRATTLLFAGVNTDQCVYASLMDACFLGYDCVLLEDCCATSSPDFCTQATLWNIRGGFGFVATSADLAGALASV